MKRLDRWGSSVCALVLCGLVPVEASAVQEVRGACSDSYSHRTVNGEVVEDLGTIGNPLSGWVGDLSTGRGVSWMTITAFTEDGKKRLASTMTDGQGAFSFPNLKPGAYYLRGEAKGYSSLRFVVQVSSSSTAIACLVE